ncbi:solute carrier organic anion transporter family member 4A1-like isoform X1 [Argonauta hians]
MSTIEKRFGFASHMSGWIASVYDITAAPIALFVCFRGATHYKLRWLGCGFICFTLGSFVMFLPHVLAPTYKWDIEDSHIHCSNISVNTTSCDRDGDDPGLSGYLGVFLVGQMLNSVGGSILYSLGVTLLDDIVKPMKTPLYIGIMMFFSTIGPALGYVIGGQFLNIFVIPSEGNDVPFGPKDTRWIGAWWIGFLVSGSLSVIIGPILLGYAKEIPVTKSIVINRISQHHSGVSHKPTANSVFHVVKGLCRNPVFLLLSLASAGEGFTFAGLTTYFPKWLENQFQKTPGDAAFMTGLLSIPAAAGGQLLGGYICKKFRLVVNGQFVLAIVSLTLSVLCTGAFWLYCEDTPFAGINTSYNSTGNSDFNDLGSNMKLASDCNEDCYCAMQQYVPICGVDKIQYFSPCFAGCTSYVPHLKKHVNCSCIAKEDHSAIDGECTTHTCSQFYWGLPLVFFLVFFAFLFQTPLASTILRVVPDEYRTFGFGVSAAIGRVLGTFPGPIVYGACLDQACKVWKPSCGSSSCWIYRQESLGLNFFLLSVIVRVITILFVITAKCLYIAPGGDKKLRELKS